MLKYFLAIVALSSSSIYLKAQVYEISSPPDEATYLNHYLKVLITAPGDSINQKMIFGDETTFVSIDSVAGEEGILWGKLDIRNSSDKEIKTVLQLSTGLGAGFVNAYLMRGGQLITTKRTSHFLSGEPRDVPHQHNPHIRLDLPAGSTSTLVLENIPVRGYHPRYDVKLYSESIWYSQERRNTIFQSVFQGMLWVLFAYNFLVFLQSGDRIFLYYSLYLLAFSTLSAILFNYFDLIAGFYATSSITVLIGISGFTAYIAFFKRFVDADRFGWTWTKVLRRIERANLILFGMAVLCSVIFFNRVLISEYILLVLTVVFALTISTLSVIAIIRKSLVAGYVITGAFFLVLGLAIGIYQFIIGHMPSIHPQLGVMAEILVFSLGLGHKVRLAEEDKRIAQIKLVKQLRKNQQMHEQMNEELERLVSERTDEVEFQKQQVEEKAKQLSVQNKELNKVNSFKDRLFAIIGHDLRNPIKTLEGVLNLHTQGQLGMKDLERFTSSLTKSLSQVISLLDNVLMWALQQMDHIKYHPASINLNSLVEANLELLMPQIQQKNLSITDQSDKEVMVYADAEMIKLVIRNVLSNAIKFSREGGSITLTSRINEQGIYLDITDTGIGISEENLKGLFSDHEVYSTYGTANEKGTGLGLKLCRDFLEINQGAIYVESKVGVGSTFSICLPEVASVLAD